jgi:RimJ/RimL family protein N-acetyltransferase
MIIAQTPRLILRQFEPRDGEAMDRVFGDPEVMRFGDGVRSPQWVRSWIITWVSQSVLSPFFGQASRELHCIVLIFIDSLSIQIRSRDRPNFAAYTICIRGPFPFVHSA